MIKLQIFNKISFLMKMSALIVLLLFIYNNFKYKIGSNYGLMISCYTSLKMLYFTKTYSYENKEKKEDLQCVI